MEGVSHAWPGAFAPLLEGLSPRPDHPDCWFAEVEVSDAQLRALNCFEGSSRHGRIWFRLPTQELVTGEMNPLLGTGGGAGAPADRVRVRISFHDVRPAPQPASSRQAVGQ